MCHGINELTLSRIRLSRPVCTDCSLESSALSQYAITFNPFDGRPPRRSHVHQIRQRTAKCDDKMSLRRNHDPRTATILAEYIAPAHIGNLGATAGLMPRLHLTHVARIQVVSTYVPCRRLHVSCIGDKIVATLHVSTCLHDHRSYRLPEFALLLPALIHHHSRRAQLEARLSPFVQL